MSTKTRYAIGGLIIGGAVNILFNLIAAAIQQRGFNDQFSEQSLWWLIGLALAGMIIGLWIDLRIERKAPVQTQSRNEGEQRGASSHQHSNPRSGSTYNVSAKVIGAVGDNPTVNQTFNTKDED